MGMLATSWNLHTKVGWSSPIREVIVKCSADNYLPEILAGLYRSATSLGKGGMCSPVSSMGFLKCTVLVVFLMSQGGERLCGWDCKGSLRSLF